MKTDRSQSWRVWALAAFLAVPSPEALLAQPEAPFPLQPGEVVVTCSSGFNPGGFVLGVVDTRDPAIHAPGTNRNWPAPMYHAAHWTSSSFGNGEVFGVALDDAPNPNIYLTATSSYGGLSLTGSGRVFKIDGTSGAVSVIADLPNCSAYPNCLGAAYAGLGSIAFDAAHDQLFVTNFFDGKIYRLSLTGAVLSTFDPFTPFDPAQNTAGFVPLGERPWGVGVSQDRVYFGVWSRDYRTGPLNSVWSVGLDALGELSGEETLEVTVPLTGTGLSMPVADIAFTFEDRMLLAERTMIRDATPGTRQSRVLEYTGGHGAWSLSGNTFAVGPFEAANAAGGVDAVCEDEQTVQVVATGDALHFAPGDYIYGLQVFPPNGGTVETSYLIDVDGDLSRPQKFLLGSVEAHDVCAADEELPPLPDFDVILNTGWDEVNAKRLTPGSDDDDWRVVTGATSTPAKVTLQPPAVWGRIAFGSQWISINPNGSALPALGTVRFEHCFCIGPDAEDAEVMFDVYADDEAVVYINGQQVAAGGRFRRSSPLMVDFHQTVGEGLLRFGENCMQVDVPNSGLYTGLNLRGMLWITHGACPANP
ncbi:MAG TPA: hypothetical protein VMW27_08270 [Thermoanaerobaculia bacterium]|nr:hypothetical protein [Thermoanaerobaculia bacterium]